MAGYSLHPRFASVQGLLFDMGDVLYDATIWRRWLVQLLGRMGRPTHYQTFFHVWDSEYLVDVHCGRREYQEAFTAFLLAQGLSRGWIDEIEAASQAKRRELAETLRPLPGVRSTVVRLHAAGLALGVLSDSESPAAVLEERLSHMGMAGCFAAVVSSFDIGRAKPDPQCYAAALEAMHLTAEQAAFVAHDADELRGAAEIGMPTIAFNYETDARADLYIERFEELLCFAPQAAATLAAAG
jgi:HAD superfamily hydrolase (TIGR01509 family)